MTLPSHLIYNEEHQILICALHRYALLPTNVIPHFTESHRLDTTTQERRVIQQAVEKLVDTVALKEKYTDFIVSDQVQNAIHGLAVNLDCYRY